MSGGIYIQRGRITDAPDLGPEWHPDEMATAMFGTFSEEERLRVWRGMGLLRAVALHQGKAEAMCTRFGSGVRLGWTFHDALEVLCAKLRDRHGDGMCLHVDVETPPGREGRLP